MTLCETSAIKLLKLAKVIDNNLNWIDLRNGNNQLLINPNFTGNPSCSCIKVDDPPTSEDDWPWDDPWSVYSTSCDPINSWNCVGNDCICVLQTRFSKKN